jgi:hypothetical protein
MIAAPNCGLADCALEQWAVYSEVLPVYGRQNS